MSRTAEYYRTHPKARSKRLRDQARINRRPEERRRRIELRRERRRRGIDGKGGPDISHTQSGKTVLEEPSINRARKGLRADKKGKKCGESYIPKKDKCSKLTPSKVKLVGGLALTAGALAGGALLAKKRFKKMSIPLTTEEWRKSPDSVINKPKLSADKNERIVNEAIAGGQKWDVHEDLNAFNERRNRLQCGRRDSLEDLLLTPYRLDDWVRARCQVGAGKSGQYYVHTSKKYGVKVHDFEGIEELSIEQVEKIAELELEMLDKAYKAGVNVPEPLALRSVKIRDKNKKQTYTDRKRYAMTMEHMDEYKPITKLYPNIEELKINNAMADKAPLIVKIKTIREFRKLHLAGIAHGDLHAGNILVNNRGKKVSLIDFGHASNIQDSKHPRYGLSQSGFNSLKTDLALLPPVLDGWNKGNEFLNKAENYTAYFDVVGDLRVAGDLGTAGRIAKKVYSNERVSAKDWQDYQNSINHYYSLLHKSLLHDAYLTANRLQVLREARRSRN